MVRQNLSRKKMKLGMIIITKDIKRFAFILALFSLISCTRKMNSETVHVTQEQVFAGIQVTDYAGRTVCLDKPVERVMVMADNALVVVKQLGAIDKVIALDSKTKGYLPLSILNETNPELQSLPDVGKTKNPNYEYIISLKPDLILFKGTRDAADTVQEKTAVPIASVISKEEWDFDLYTTIGKMIGKEKEAKVITHLLKDKKTELEKALSLLPESQVKKAYIIVQNSSGNLFKTLKNSLSLELAGINNVASEANSVDEWGFAEISKEEFLNYDPDFIFLDKPSGSDGIQKKDVLSDSTFKFCPAVQNQKLYLTHTFSLPKDYVYVILEAYYYAHTAYPDLITDKLYHDTVNEIFNAAYGIENYYESWEESLL